MAKKVLLVEDDNNLREIFQMRLTAEGYSAVTAADGEEGLVVAMKEKPDLIITDVMMPKLSGFEMVENLRSAPEMKDVKVIMMTALGQAEDQARGEKLGVVKYLVKSQVTLEDFARVVTEVLGPSGPDDAATDQPIVSQSNNQESETSMQPDSSSTNPTPSDNSAPADPAAPTPAPNPMSDTGQQDTVDEQTVVTDQINSFVSGPAAPADPAAPVEPTAPAPTPDPVVPAPGDTTMPSMPAAPADPAAPVEPTAPAPGEQPGTPPTDPTANAL
jgi:CheY-like chemotaxis protein